MTAFERETLRYLGNATADERLMALIASVEAELRKDVRPRGVYRRLPIAVSEGRVEAGGHVFESSALAKNLCGCGEAFFLAATLGAEADRRLRRFSALDLPRAAVWRRGALPIWRNTWTAWRTACAGKRRGCTSAPASAPGTATWIYRTSGRCLLCWNWKSGWAFR